ncbi:MAG TPA: carboxyl transferase domain-containing protein [Nitriliruptorales bacterium]|nr:carboxyl transferase domain-containing protein [Nitriliruptorales bacterium]
MSFERLAIINRGEAAMRVLHALAEYNREHGTSIRSIALYTEPDASAWFVRQADETYDLGPAMYFDEEDDKSKYTYLDYDRLERAIRETEADAVWVGWGFVSEHADFARLCDQLGVTYVGPPGDVIDRLGNKIAAKQLAENADVPVVPWSEGPLDTLDEAETHAEKIGYPLVVKAAAGGGGRGIRTVSSADELPEAFESSRSEGESAFGDPTVFLERQLGDARHVEVQVIADRHGTAWAVGVRDCSIQRRRQKVLEESSSTALSPEEDQALRDAAVRLALEAGYTNAGTVEFLYEPDGQQYYFMEVNTRLQVEHPVTELTTGLDLVKLQLHVARGERLEGEPPPTTGHAIEARLYAEDPERGFSPAPGRIAHLRFPTGPGVRVETGVTEDDEISPDFDAMIAKFVAYGQDRSEALARLRRALAQSIVIIDGGTTNKAFLLNLLDRPELAEGRFDTGWLDELTERGDHLPELDPAAVLLAAVEAYDVEHASDRAHFHASAGRGRPEASSEAGKRIDLRYRGGSYRMTTYRLGPETYRIDTDDGSVDLRVDRLGEHELRVAYAGRRLKAVRSVQGPTHLIEVDGVPHRVMRDEGGVLRSPSPGVVISVRVAEGDEVEADEAVLVLEAMKMETTISAPYAGRVRTVEVAENVQVDAGAVLVRIEPTGDDQAEAEEERVSFRTGEGRQDRGSGAERRDRLFDALRSYLLGYDLDPEQADRLTDEYEQVRAELPPDDEALLEREEEVLDAFADFGSLSRRQRDPDVDEEQVRSPQEHLFTYLRSPDRADELLPQWFLDRLERALGRYGVDGLDRTPQLEDALLWMYRAFQRIGELTPTVAAILDRHVEHHAALRASERDDYRSLLDRLISVANGRYPTVSDLAREVRFQAFDRPLLDRSRDEVYAEMDQELDALVETSDTAEREEHLARLVDCPQPLRGKLLERYRRGDEPLREAVLEVRTRRYYRARELRDLHVEWIDGRPLAVADYEHEGDQYHLVVAYGDGEGALGELVGCVRRHLDDVLASRAVVVDIALSRSGSLLDGDSMQREVAGWLDGVGFGRQLHRLDVMITTTGSGPEHQRTQHFTYRQDGDGFREDELYRNLHPMLGKRLGLWRLSNFRVERLPSVEDVFLFHGVAEDNPNDERLFALAEIRDLTTVTDESGKVVSVPHAERMLVEALSGIRRFQTQRPPGDRLLNNVVLLRVEPPLTLPPDVWRDVARQLAPATLGLGLEKVVARGRIPDPETGDLVESELHVENVAELGIVVRREAPSDEPIQPLSEYRQNVLATERRDSPYPYELARMLTPADGMVSDFPAGSFEEYDLDDDGRLVPVDRPPGRNSAAVVVGVISNRTEAVPEGMQRVMLLSDPSTSLGSMAEAECRRVIAAMDLAEDRQLPVEWFALSSGARVSMESGTENMDWIAGVLRRIIEFTQSGGEFNVIVTGINVGAQPYFNAEATMLMHTSGILVMVPDSAMVLTGKRALDFSGGVSAEDNRGIGGFERIMGPNGEAQYWAPSLEEACALLFRHYEHGYVVAGERFPRRVATDDPHDRDVRDYPHGEVEGADFECVGDIFSDEHNPERKKPFSVRAVMRAVSDQDREPLERWSAWRDAENTVVWDARIGGIPVCLLGVESRTLPRHGFVPADGPSAWTSGTLLPQSSKKMARAINAASGKRPVVVLANLSGFDGSPESMRKWQLEFGAEIGRAVTNFRGPVVFCVISRYHGGAFVVFSKRLNPGLEVAAIEGSYASVIGGTPAAAVVFAKEVRQRTHDDERVASLREELAEAADAEKARLEEELEQVEEEVHAEKLREVASEFDAVHTIERAREVGSVDRIVAAAELRPYLIDALERGMAR